MICGCRDLRAGLEMWYGVGVSRVHDQRPELCSCDDHVMQRIRAYKLQSELDRRESLRASGTHVLNRVVPLDETLR